MNLSFGKFEFVLNCILLLAVLISASCKRETDSEFPVILVQSPVEGSVYQVDDTIHLKAVIHDNNKINSLKITLVDSDNRPVLPSVAISSPSNPYTLNADYAIDDSLIESGIYELQFQAFDGINTANAYVRIQVIALPRRFLYPIAITRPSTNEVSAYAPDTSGQWKEIFARQGDYAGSAVNSAYGYLYITGASSAGLTAYNLKQKKIDWSIPAEQLPVNRWFESISFYKPLLYVSYYDGYIKAFDKTGRASFTSVTTGLYVPGVSCAFDGYVAASLQEKNSDSHSLAIYNTPGGNIRQLISPVPQIIAFSPSEKFHLLSFGNQSGNGIIQEYDSRFGTFTDLKVNPNDSIYSVSAMDVNNYVISGKTKLYWYSYNQNSLVEFATGLDKARVACETIGMQVFATSDRNLFIYSYPQGILQKTIPIP